ncbi:hypothetical protein C8Q74DRAFT_1369819 [Fomes fomentarius]|nr:hypothetical protein C8Q74DRAFT_1369819 [Fomes fomentarius]
MSATGPAAGIVQLSELRADKIRKRERPTSAYVGTRWKHLRGHFLGPPDMTTPIPSLPGLPFLGNITAIETEVPLRSLNLLAKQYGEIYQLNIVGNKLVMISSYDLLNEISDEKRFIKKVGGALLEVRNGVGDGLFTAHVPGEQNWYIARTLNTSFW